MFRHFPLTQIHPHAEPAAEAAEAAGAQGAFWEMHAALFENQRSLQYEDLLKYAATCDVDLPRFVREMAEHTYADRVREDFLGGVRSGVNGTPTFFINGVRYDGSLEPVSLTGAIAGAAGL